MTTSQMSMTSVISNGDEPLTPEQLGYLEAYAQDQAHEAVLKLFTDLSNKGKVTRARLARRLGKKPEQVTRWLAVPGNWTLRTLADLLGAMGYVPVFGASPLDALSRRNYFHPLTAKRVGEGETISTDATIRIPTGHSALVTDVV